MSPQDVVVASVYLARLRKRGGLRLVPANWKRVVCEHLIILFVILDRPASMPTAVYLETV
jgi:hypothetical protein